MEYKIIIKGRPFSVNQQYIRKKGAAKYILSPEAKVYGDLVGWQLNEQWKQKPLLGDLEVFFYFYFNSHLRRDHLNFSKVLCDRFNQKVWCDDSQIKISHHYTAYDNFNPRIEILIKSLDKIQ